MIKATSLKIGNTVLYNGIYGIVLSINSPASSPDPRYNNKYIIELFVNGLIDALEEELEGIPMQDWFAIQKRHKNTGKKISNYWVYENGTDWILMNHIDSDTWSIGHKKVFPQSLRLFDVEFVHELQNIIANLK